MGGWIHHAQRMGPSDTFLDGEAGVLVQHNFPTSLDTVSKSVSLSKPFPSHLHLVLGAHQALHHTDVLSAEPRTAEPASLQPSPQQL